MGANYFSSVVELNILSEEGKYSKARSELILRVFFLNEGLYRQISSQTQFQFKL
ncbi:MAG: DUF4783 domain-containing protein [Sphingobacterium thalpophilum]